MTEKSYIFTITRFQCGCVYRTVGDTAIFCPRHRSEWHRGSIRETETIYTPTAEAPDIPGLVMHTFKNPMPVTIRNSRKNSLHSMVTTVDADGNEWDEPSEKYVGLCTACFIDHGGYLESKVAACECRNERCSYRWCGTTTGLHAFWRLHAQGRSEETTGIPEEDIFSHGKFDELNKEVALALEPVYNLFRISTVKASTTICRLVLSFLSQFFQSRRHFSSQAKDRSTTHRFGSTTKVCSSLRFTTSTAAPNRPCTAVAKGFPV